MILVHKSLRNFFDRLISQSELQRKEDFVDFLSWEWQTENTIRHYLVFNLTFELRELWGLTGMFSFAWCFS